MISYPYLIMTAVTLVLDVSHTWAGQANVTVKVPNCRNQEWTRICGVAALLDSHCGRDSFSFPNRKRQISLLYFYFSFEHEIDKKKKNFRVQGMFFQQL